MSYTMISNEKYTKECEKGTKICIWCGQWNDKNQHNCWYCGGNHIIPFNETGSIRPTSKLPVSRADNSYTVDTMIVDNNEDFYKRIENFKNMISPNITTEDYITYLQNRLEGMHDDYEYKKRDED